MRIRVNWKALRDSSPRPPNGNHDFFLSGCGRWSAGGDAGPCPAASGTTLTQQQQQQPFKLATSNAPLQNLTLTHFSLIFPSVPVVQHISVSSLAFTYRWRGGQSRHGKRAVPTGAETQRGSVLSLPLLVIQRTEGKNGKKIVWISKQKSTQLSHTQNRYISRKKQTHQTMELKSVIMTPLQHNVKRLILPSI